jgi:hypothetical protein
MSPHYKVRLDISEYPYNNNTILSEETANMLYNSWEYVKPVCKFAHYEIYIEPPCDLTGNEVSLYEIRSDYGEFKTRFLKEIEDNVDSYVYLKRELYSSKE